jgi:DNA-binding SARP family transcriptional activator
MLTINLFGAASFSVDGVVLKSDFGPTGRLLACYLFAFPGRVHRRERLADLFWRDNDQTKVRSALNTAIWRIRRILDQGHLGAARHLMTVGDDLILEPSRDFQVDTYKLESASELFHGRSPRNLLTASEIENLCAAIDVYKGPFLEDRDDDWVLQERERLHCLFVRSSVELMRAAVAKHDYEQALNFGRRILAIDPLREGIQRGVILLLALNSQRVEAVRAYQRLSELLRTELELDPMPETQRLFNEVVSGEIFRNVDEYLFSEFNIRQL